MRNYAGVNRAAVKEMHRQVGDLVLDARGIAQRGLLVRHLVLPHGIAGTGDVLRFLAEEISRDTYLNLICTAARHPFQSLSLPELCENSRTSSTGKGLCAAKIFVS